MEENEEVQNTEENGNGNEAVFELPPLPDELVDEFATDSQDAEVAPDQEPSLVEPVPCPDEVADLSGTEESEPQLPVVPVVLDIATTAKATPQTIIRKSLIEELMRVIPEKGIPKFEEFWDRPNGRNYKQQRIVELMAMIKSEHIREFGGEVVYTEEEIVRKRRDEMTSKEEKSSNMWERIMETFGVDDE